MKLNNKDMTKGEVFKELKEMFIKRFGVGKEVNVGKRIEIAHSWDVGGTYLTKVRYNGKKFEYYEECWSSDWVDNEKVFNEFGIRALSSCLGVKVRTRTEYFIDLW